MSLVETAYKKSLELLRANAVAEGFLASTPTEESCAKDYPSIFARDASICVLGALASGDKDLLETAQRSLLTLRDSATYFGQLPFYYNPGKKETYFYFTNTLDGTPWWIIASLIFAKHSPTLLDKNYREALEAAIYWLAHLANPQNGLISQDDSQDWADCLPRHGYVLYTNVLWYKALELYLGWSKNPDPVLADYLVKVHASINTLFWTQKLSHCRTDYFPKSGVLQDAKLEDQLEFINSQTQYLPYYLTSISFFGFDWRCDVYANILAVLFGLADEKKTAAILDWLERSAAAEPYPVRVYYPPIYPGEDGWRDYMFRLRQNFPWQYHNGGIWPYVGGFYSHLLAKLGQKKAAEAALEKLAEANSLNNWEFNEYLHGQTGKPMGMLGQSWNAATYLLAYFTVKSGQFPL